VAKSGSRKAYVIITWSKIVKQIKTAAIFIYAALTVPILLAPALPLFIVSLFGMKKPVSWIVYRLAQIWGRSLIAITGCRVTVEGTEHIPRKGSVCFTCNHEGIFDIVLALAYIGRPFGFIAKKELALIPLLNIWILILGGLFIDRKNIRKAVKTINLGIQKIQKGGGMLIFPEGTRSKGRGLLPFRSGAIKLATNSLAPIVPVAISGSSEVFEKDFCLHSAALRLVFCPPIITADMPPDDRRHKLADEVRGIIETTLNRGEKGT